MGLANTDLGDVLAEAMLILVKHMNLVVSYLELRVLRVRTVGEVVMRSGLVVERLPCCRRFSVTQVEIQDLMLIAALTSCMVVEVRSSTSMLGLLLCWKPWKVQMYMLDSC